MNLPTSPSALDAAEIVARKVKSRKAPVRRSFVERFHPDSAPPPMATLLRGGRGGEVRLKLFLSMLWFAGKEPYDVTYPARAWATLLDLDDPEGRGARRVSDAIRWLSRSDLVEVELRPGRPSRVTLLCDSGSGEKYQYPANAIADLKDKSKSGQPDSERLKQHFYFRLPPEFWTQGYAAGLSGRAIAMLLAVLSELGRSGGTTLWFSPRRAKDRFDLSTETRGLALRELVDLGVLSVHRKSVNTDVFDFRRVRNVYTLVKTELLAPGS